MKQPSLFDPAPTDRQVVGIAGSRPALSPAQKRFNRLVVEIGAQREVLRGWEEFAESYGRRVTTDFEPLREQLRVRRIAMTGLLDQAMDDKALGKAHRVKVRDLMLGLLSLLLSEQADPKLVALHDKYSELTFEEELTQAREAATAMFGLEAGALGEDLSADELARRIREEMDRAVDGRGPKRTGRPRKGGKNAAEVAAARAQEDRDAEGASRALREVFRKLASALHPDRERDADERVRKTRLMQRVNQAYQADDLLTLLQLQTEIEQIDPAALSEVAEDRLLGYNRVLDDQLRRLAEETAKISGHFADIVGPHRPRGLTPALVMRTLDADLRELRVLLQSLDNDLVALRDIKVLKSRLRQYRLENGDDAELEELANRLLLVQDRTRRSTRSKR